MHGDCGVMSALSAFERLMEALRQAPLDSICHEFGAKQSLVFGLEWKHMQQLSVDRLSQLLDVC